MKKTLVLAALFCCAGFLFAQKQITLDDCFVFYKFYPESGARYKYMKDGLHYIDSEEGKLHIRSVLNEKFDSVLTLKLTPAASEFDQFVFSDDETLLLLRTRTEPVYRHSVLANYFVYNLQSGETLPVYESGKQQFVTLSPDGKRLAFVAGNNLFIKDLVNKKTTQVTSDGEKNKIINGLPDWVYEEEFSPVDGDGMVAAKWSPDGSMLAFIRFDETNVPEFPLTWYDGANYPRRTAFKYPKVGAPNSIVSVRVYDADAGNDKGELMGLEPDDYVPRIHWTNDNKLVMSRLNRMQDTVELLVAMTERIIADPETRTKWIPVRPMLRETDAAYVELESEYKLTFLKAGGFLWTSERSGFQHIHQFSGAPNDAGKDMTPGNFDITAFYGVDDKTGKFYYQTATPTPLDREVWEGDLKGGAPRLLTPKTGTNDVVFSPTFEYFTHTWQDANTPPVVTLRKRSGETLRTLVSNNRVTSLRREYGFVDKKFFQIKINDSIVLNASIMQPANMDSTRKYPVLFDNYGGPGSQTVLNSYDGFLGSWQQMLVQKGYVIVSVDNRGTGGRGRAFKKCTQLQLGKYETEDQISAARYFRAQPWVDPGRIGIWGWSFGGYLSTSCVLKGNDVFKMAMAVAPVTNWKWYDSAYTERYMHTTKNNAAGYNENSPVNFATLLRGDNYLICHGTADDNVHWQQTTEMINALVKAGKQFDTYYYPNRNHGISGDNATRHLFTKLTDFVQEKL
ncbi:MAG TPA: S9 family peptidase [Saprospiraceae bacterium]|nr:S9 family peptidase [Saprospiraceae bacterium]HPI08116.1 S9 family peptidase [Saprospiraceae bacterium]